MPTYRQGEASIAGKTAQDFPLEVWGKPGHLTDLKGKVVILNFWATWCPPCVEETPALNRLQKYVESRNALVLGVSVDEDPAAYEKFLRTTALFFRPSANLGKSWRSTTALRCSLRHTSSTGTEKSYENSSHPNSGIHRICWRISTPSSDKPKNEHQKDNQTQRRREFPEQIQENAQPLPLVLFSPVKSASSRGLF